jgi:bifunctional enzyme CysN/CysC
MTTVLRFLTCGSVDDGKSTLIGRLLHDAGLVPSDQWESVLRLSEQRAQTGDLPDFSLLLDGLVDERAQGITIDVAWRYFQTPRRKFVMGDSPGHEQYTRNMATAASQCDMALLLVDARKGIVPQTRRHAAIVWLLGIRKIVVVANKMDLVDWDELTFIELQRQFLEFSKLIGLAAPVFLPVSALHGDNVLQMSKRMPWYTGPSLFELLETADVPRGGDDLPFRFPVQWINRAGDFRGYSGTVASGNARPGDTISVLPSGVRTKIRSIVTFNGEEQAATTGAAVTIRLVDDVDVTRGDVLAADGDASAVSTEEFEANMVWMDEQALLPGRRYELRLATTTVPATVKRLIHRLNLETMREEPATRLEKNDIGRCEVMTERALQCDLYSRNRHTGGFILVDRTTNRTAGAGMVTSNETRHLFWETVAVDKVARAGLKSQRPRVVWFTGLSGAGKSTIANAVEQALFREGFHTYLIDGDNVRHGLSKDLGFGDSDRIENTRRVGELAKLMLDAGLIVLVSLISPFRAERRMVREILQPGEFVEIYVSTPLEVCESRDRKGLYRLAREGRIQNFTGISSPYEPPERAELSLDTSKEPLEICIQNVISLLRKP